MRAERIVILHTTPDVARQLSGLEACLVNFAYVDQLRAGILYELTDDLDGTPAFFRMVESLPDGPAQVRLEGPCPDADALFERAVTEQAWAERLIALIRRRRVAWIRRARASARTKLPLLPQAWHALFEAVPRDKHLPVLCVLLAKRKPGQTEQSHAEWVAGRIQSILYGD